MCEGEAQGLQGQAGARGSLGSDPDTARLGRGVAKHISHNDNSFLSFSLILIALCFVLVLPCLGRLQFRFTCQASLNMNLSCLSGWSDFPAPSLSLGFWAFGNLLAISLSFRGCGLDVRPL